ncbi:MAG: hypothetical protein TU35_001885 [Thermoproteus sp. AZ2]|uniref:Uncharacterized protein n=1 Tax=Thermoproteus sp. AZ2 TaxID=1609232 RepID=A0ACC6UZL2_9CREN
MLIRVNLLDVLGSDIGFLGELVASKLLPGAARGDVVAMLVEGVISAERVEAPGEWPLLKPSKEYISAHVEGKWPIHKSWFVPALGPEGYKLFLDPPKGLIRYVGKDSGEFAAVLKAGLEELAGFVERGEEAPHVVGIEGVTGEERAIAARLAWRAAKLDDEELADVIEALRQVDFLVYDGEAVYHVEVKTSTAYKPAKLRKKQMALAARQKALERLGLRPALAYVVPREDWNIEIFIES